MGWYSFISYFNQKWRQGEHVTLIGRTGSGKSVLGLEIIRRRRYYVLLLSKGRDDTLDKFIDEEETKERNNFEVISKWPPSGFSEKVVLWPKFKGVDSFATQQEVFRSAINGYRSKGGQKIDGIYTEGNWAVLIDEVMYFVEELRLEPELRMLWTQGRSNGISLVASAQRPVNVPRLMVNQWTHFFSFKTTDKAELNRLAEIGGDIADTIRQNVPKLGFHQFLYVNGITGEAIVSKVELKR